MREAKYTGFTMDNPFQDRFAGNTSPDGLGDRRDDAVCQPAQMHRSTVPVAMSERWGTELSRSIAAYTGLHFPKERWGALQRAVKRAATALGFKDSESYCEWVLEPPFVENRIQSLAEYITIGETHFFRDQKLFQALEEEILPNLIGTRRNNGRTLKIWSAGCATGEEPYSIAIVIRKLILDLCNWRIDLIATDINKNSIRKATEGIYSQWSFRGLPKEFKRTYFMQKGDSYCILPDAKQMVTFSHHNLVKDSYLPFRGDARDVDVIFCRNVIMYFTPERQKQVLENLVQSLADGGLLIVSPAEASIIDSPMLVAENIRGVIVHRKGQSRPSKLDPFKLLSFDPPPVLRMLSGPASQLQIALPAASSFETERQEFTSPPTLAPQPEIVTAALKTPHEEALSLYEQGSYEAVTDRLLSYLESNDSTGDHFQTMFLLARAYADQGKLDEAMHWVERAIGEDKLNPECHYLRGVILQEKNELEGAAASLQKALFLDPDLVVAHFALGNLALRRGRPGASNRHLRIALEILAGYAEHEYLPASAGITAGQLREMISGITGEENSHEHR